MANNGTKVPGFRRKVMVDIDRIMALSAELRSSVPANIREAEEIIKQKDSILSQATLEAQRVRTSAEQEATSVTSAAIEEHQYKVGDSEIVKAAEEKGKEITDEAVLEGQQIVQDAQRRAARIVNESESGSISRRDGADQYAREVLFNLEENLAEVLGQVRRGIDALRLEVEAQQQKQQQINNSQQIPV